MLFRSIGLGRYGDSIDPDGWLIALDSMFSMLKSGGVLYISAPIGEPGLEFNAHRIFHLPDLLNAVSERANIRSVSILDDHDRVMTEDEVSTLREMGLPQLRYGCAIVTAQKHESTSIPFLP